MCAFTLGLDLGPTSIGWAIVNEADGRIVSMRDGTPGCGVRHFKETINPKNKATLCSERRMERGARRNRRRRRMRREALRAILSNHGLLPAGGGSECELEQRLADRPNEPKRFAHYELRKRALTDALTSQEFGRVLLHINKRRGFRSPRKQGSSPDDGKINRAMGEFETSLRSESSGTVGNHLYRIAKDEVLLPQKVVTREVEGNRIRGRVIERKLLEEEFDRVWSGQKQHIPTLRDDSLRAQIKSIVFDQRPLKSSKRMIGRCECLPKLPRCPRADWVAQQWRILKEVNNLRIHRPDGTIDEINPAIRRKLVDALNVQAKLTFDEMRTLVGVDSDCVFNLEKGPGTARSKGSIVRKALKGNAVEAAILKAFGQEAWGACSGGKKSEVREHVANEADSGRFIRIATEDWGLTPERATKLAGCELPEGYMSYSREALEKMIEKFQAALETEHGINEYEAKRLCEFQAVGSALAMTTLPPPLRRDGTPLTTNPMVRNALWQVRKVVNALLREVGLPSKIKVEIVREMKGSLRERVELVERQKKNKAEREEIKQTLGKDFQVASPTSADVLVYRLWKEQNYQSPYSDRMISCSDLKAFLAARGKSPSYPASRRLGNKSMLL